MRRVLNLLTVNKCMTDRWKSEFYNTCILHRKIIRAMKDYDGRPVQTGSSRKALKLPCVMPDAPTNILCKCENGRNFPAESAKNFNKH